MSGFRINALDGPYHFRREEDVVRRNDFREQIDAGLVIDTGVKVNIVQQQILQKGTLHVLSDTAITAPVVRHSPAAVRDNEFESGEIFEQVAGQELHEGRGVAIYIVRTRGMEGGIAGAGDMNHRGYFELDHFFIDGVPPAIGERGFLPVAARRIWIQIATYEAEILDATLQFRQAVRGRHTRRLRKLTDSDEVFRVQIHNAMNHVVADARPGQAQVRVSDVMAHRRRAGRKNCEVGAALSLKFQLCRFQALADLIVADVWLCRSL